MFWMNEQQRKMDFKDVLYRLKGVIFVRAKVNARIDNKNNSLPLRSLYFSLQYFIDFYDHMNYRWKTANLGNAKQAMLNLVKETKLLIQQCSKINGLNQILFKDISIVKQIRKSNELCLIQFILPEIQVE